MIPNLKNRIIVFVAAFFLNIATLFAGVGILINVIFWVVWNMTPKEDRDAEFLGFGNAIAWGIGISDIAVVATLVAFFTGVLSLVKHLF